MTQLTIPSSGSRGDEPIAEVAGTVEAAQQLDRRGIAVNEATEITSRDDEAGHYFPYIETAAATNITTTSEAHIISTTPNPPQAKIHPPSPFGNSHSASRLISDWFAALYVPIRPRSKPRDTETIGREDVLLPPNIARRISNTSTRRSTRRTDIYQAHSPSPVLFSTGNPNNWRAAGEWDCAAPFTAAQSPAPVCGGEDCEQDEEVRRLMAEDLGSIHSQGRGAVSEKENRLTG